MSGDSDNPVQEESRQEDETEKFDQSTSEDSPPREPTVGESVPESQASEEPVQVADSGTPVNSDEQVQKESGDDKPAESEGNTPVDSDKQVEKESRDDKPAESEGNSLVNSDEQVPKESGDDKPAESEGNADNEEKGTEEKGKSEDTNDGEKRPEIQQAEQTQEGGVSVPQGTDGSTDQVASVEQQGEEVQKEGDKQPQGEVPSAIQVEQQEMLAPSQEEGDKPAQSEGEVENPTENQESEQQATKEQAEAEANQIDRDSTKQSSPDEKSPESEDQLTPAESKAETVRGNEAANDGQKIDDSEEKPGTKPDESENAQENETVVAQSAEIEPATERQEESAGEVGKPVESQQQVQSEASSVSKPAVVAAGQVVSLPADGASPELQEENKKLKQDIFIMKQQEDAYRIKVLSLEQEVGKLRARKIDNRSQGE